MKLTHIRNATLTLTYAGTRFLIDPMLAPKGAWPGFSGSAREHLRNPLVDLPFDLDALLQGIDAVIVTHLHDDHWDEFAQHALSKQLPIYSQNTDDAARIQEQGFYHVHVLGDETLIAGITVIKNGGQHGSDALYANPAMAARLGETCGLVFRHHTEKTLYIAGDTVWTSAHEDTLHAQTPEVIVLNAGFAQLNGYGAIIMGKEDVLRTHQTLPDATVIASHMEAVNHCLLSRAELRDYVAEKGIEAHVLIPEDGEMMQL